MNPQLITFLAILVPGLISTIFISLNAKKINAQWRAKRAAQQATR